VDAVRSQHPDGAALWFMFDEIQEVLG